MDQLMTNEVTRILERVCKTKINIINMTNKHSILSKCKDLLMMN